ncbi:hypothetical protein ED733_000538 [Metarhizium rileyi]|uniref:Uncharacterized protein n=1 Tax=Metarhizium rileyi (strain RCEF 4871) TaxID=1649241 RepID=A0A5C6G2F7_METRR|nr:hypothetical protein ED733_000538 [Metarhizium rileyi]
MSHKRRCAGIFRGSQQSHRDESSRLGGGEALAEASCALANRASVLMNSIAVSGGTAGGQRAVGIHDKTKWWDGLKPSIELLGGFFFGCNLERLQWFMSVSTRNKRRALAVREQFVRPPQAGWEGLWRELVLHLDTLDDGPMN